MTTAIPYASPPITTARSARLESLDIFRGMTIAGMILVNSMGDPKYDPLEHASWNGWTPTDLIFPFFVFIMGTAIPFSMSKRSAGDSRFGLLLHILSRGLAIFLLGEFCYSIPRPPDAIPAGFFMLHIARYVAILFLCAGFIVLLIPWKDRRLSLIIPLITAVVYLAVLAFIAHVDHAAMSTPGFPAKFNWGGGMLFPDRLRIPGVLQRLGVCYAVAASIALFANWQIITLLTAAILIGYSWVMLKVPYPSLTEPGKIVHGRLDQLDNLARYVDTNVLGAHVYGEYPDPEGILSTIPAIATCLLGILTGIWLRSKRTTAERCAGMLSFGVIAVVLATILDAAVMPINKRLWSTSYVVECAGLALLGLGTYFFLVDHLNYKRIFAPFKWYGMNAITAFIGAALVARTLGVVRWQIDANPPKFITLNAWLAGHARDLAEKIPFGDPAKNASLGFPIALVLFFLIIMGFLYQANIFLSVGASPGKARVFPNGIRSGSAAFVFGYVGAFAAAIAYCCFVSSPQLRWVQWTAAIGFIAGAITGRLFAVNFNQRRAATLDS